jgi:hypothetical protein
VPSAWLASAARAAAAALPGAAPPARGGDVGRLLGGLARLRPNLPPAAYAAADADDAGSGGAGEAGAAERDAAAGTRPSGLQVWAGDNVAAVAALLEAAAPVLPHCSARELATVAQATAALGAAQAPAAFRSALVQAAAALEQSGNDAELEPARAALQQLR